MYWKRQGEYEYLVKTQPDNRQQRIGPRSEQTERTYTEFTARKQALEERLQSLREALTEAERMNKALKAGRVPSMVVSVLQTLENAANAEHRLEAKRRRDIRQTDIVQHLLDDGLLLP